MPTQAIFQHGQKIDYIVFRDDSEISSKRDGSIQLYWYEGGLGLGCVVKVKDNKIVNSYNYASIDVIEWCTE